MSAMESLCIIIPVIVVVGLWWVVGAGKKREYRQIAKSWQPQRQLEPVKPVFQTPTLVEQHARQELKMELQKQKAQKVMENIQEVKAQIDDLASNDIIETVQREHDAPADPDIQALLGKYHDQRRELYQQLLLQVLKDMVVQNSAELERRLWDDHDVSDYVDLYDRVKLLAEKQSSNQKGYLE
jgi:hypothetical protein